MKLFESELVLGERVAVGGLRVYPLIGPGSDGPADPDRTRGLGIVAGGGG